MGFYGNITNTSKTQFQFDKIYRNRRAMDISAANDGIYMGRYVLVDYGKKEDNIFKTFYVNDVNNSIHMWKDVSFSNTTIVQFPADVKTDEVVKAINSKTGEYQFYKCTNKENSPSDVAIFERITGADNSYAYNYEIDKAFYSEKRGYDSTVWQKVFIGNDSKYVMVAELNAMAPSFEIVVDAPTMNPIPPHFDNASNEMEYLMHIQPQWGMRVKAADPKAGTSSDMTTTQSDEQVVWQHYSYNRAEDEESVTTENVAGAIYYNKAGFNSEIVSYSDLNNEITITPTGISGRAYNKHNGKNPSETEKKPDIQEISIILPSIGNSISQMWDIVYGSKEQNPGKFYEDENGIVDTSKPVRNTDIKWNSTEGLRLIKKKEDGNGFTFDTDDVKTLAGCINSVHDLMGMIIKDDYKDQTLENINAEELEDNAIYYIQERYYYKNHSYNYYDMEDSDYEYVNIEINENVYLKDIFFYKEGDSYSPATDNEYDSDKKYRKKILTDSGKTKEFYIYEDSSNKFRKYSKWNNDNNIIPSSIKLGTRIEGYNLKELQGFSKDLNTIHGLILEINRIFSVGDSETRDSATIQGCLNQINDILEKFNNIPSNTFLMVNQYGNFRGVEIDGGQWIDANVNYDPENPKLLIQHKERNKELWDQGAENIELEELEGLSIEYWKFDDAGHAYEKTAKKIKISDLKIEDVVYHSETDEDLTPEIINADTFQGENIDYFASKNWVLEQLGIIENGSY